MLFLEATHLSLQRLIQRQQAAASRQQPAGCEGPARCLQQLWCRSLHRSLDVQGTSSAMDWLTAYERLIIEEFFWARKLLFHLLSQYCADGKGLMRAKTS